jgi:hypothetical protein
MTPTVIDYTIRRIASKARNADQAELEMLRFASRHGALIDPLTVKRELLTNTEGDWFVVTARCVVLEVPRLGEFGQGFRRVAAAGGWPAAHSRAERQRA